MDKQPHTDAAQPTPPAPAAAPSPPDAAPDAAPDTALDAAQAPDAAPAQPPQAAAEVNAPQWPVPATQAARWRQLPALARQALRAAKDKTSALAARLDRMDRASLVQAGTLAASALTVAWSIYSELRRDEDDSAAHRALPNPDPTPDPAPDALPVARVARGLVTEYVRAHSRTTHRVGDGYEETVTELTIEALRFVSVQVEERPLPPRLPSKHTERP